MKKILLMTLFLGSLKLFAQPLSEKEAHIILTEISEKHKSFDAVKTEFTYTLENPVLNINETQSGTLYIQPQTGKYKFILEQSEVFSDGTASYVYFKDVKEIQINNIEEDEDDITPVEIFTLYDEKDFKSRLISEKKEGEAVFQTIELVPVDSRSFSRIELKADKQKKLISQVKIFDKNGNIYTYKVNKFMSNPVIDASFFSYDKKKYPGVEVVDLR